MHESVINHIEAVLDWDIPETRHYRRPALPGA